MTLHERQLQSYRRAGRALLRAWPSERALDEARLVSFLDEVRYCVLATTTGRGRPQARPVAFMVFDDALWFGTGAGGKLTNVRRDPWVSTVISERDGDEHRAVVADGSVSIAESPPAGFLDLWKIRFGSPPEWASHWLELRPERVFSYGAPASGA